MYEFIEGNLIEITPDHVVSENGGIGYFINISVNTYSFLSSLKKARLYIHYVVREDAHLLFGFAEKGERDLFRLLITVSGIGANTARIMLSSLSPDEIIKSISTGNVAVLQSIKGIGAKSAQRVIVDLKDKVSKDIIEGGYGLPEKRNFKEESVSALVMLGFQKSAVEKVINRLLSESDLGSVEELVKMALKRL